MKMTKLLVSMPESLKAKLDALRTQDYTASGFVRSLIERELQQPAKKGR